MKSVEIKQTKLGGNPQLHNGYLVYSDGRAHPGGGYEAWYWISGPNKEGKFEISMIGMSRFGEEVYKTVDLAAVIGMSIGAEIANRWPKPDTKEYREKLAELEIK